MKVRSSDEEFASSFAKRTGIRAWSLVASTSFLDLIIRCGKGLFVETLWGGISGILCCLGIESSP
jgi:hypothetical protein